MADALTLILSGKSSQACMMECGVVHRLLTMLCERFQCHESHASGAMGNINLSIFTFVRSLTIDELYIGTHAGKHRHPASLLGAFRGCQV